MVGRKKNPAAGRDTGMNPEGKQPKPVKGAMKKQAEAIGKNVQGKSVPKKKQ